VCALDRVFQVVFARSRRKLGDANIESAWRTAKSAILGYIGWPVAAASAASVMAFYALLGVGSPAQHRLSIQVAAAGGAVAIALVLDRRFRKYLSAPPPLAPEESSLETRSVLWFRTVSIGVFILTCLVGILLHIAGFNLR
jgi:hypothetical protein